MILEAHGFCGEVSYYSRLIKRPFVFEAFRLRQSRRDGCIDPDGSAICKDGWSATAMGLVAFSPTERALGDLE
jgi:hypothetical protein